MEVNVYTLMATVAALFLVVWVFRLPKMGMKALPMTLAFAAMTAFALLLGLEGPNWARWTAGLLLGVFLVWDMAARGGRK